MKRLMLVETILYMDIVIRDHIRGIEMGADTKIKTASCTFCGGNVYYTNLSDGIRYENWDVKKHFNKDGMCPKEFILDRNGCFVNPRPKSY